MQFLAFPWPQAQDHFQVLWRVSSATALSPQSPLALLISRYLLESSTILMSEYTAILSKTIVIPLPIITPAIFRGASTFRYIINVRMLYICQECEVSMSNFLLPLNLVSGPSHLGRTWVLQRGVDPYPADISLTLS